MILLRLAVLCIFHPIPLDSESVFLNAPCCRTHCALSRAALIKERSYDELGKEVKSR